MKNKNILYISGESSLQSGANLKMIETANYFNNKKGYKTYIAIANPGSEKERKKIKTNSKIETHFCPLYRPHRPLSLLGLLKYFYYFPFSVFCFIKLIKKKKIDIVHINELFDFAGLFAAKIKKRKTITHVRVIFKEPKLIKTIIKKIIITLSDRIVCVSGAVKKEMFSSSENKEKIKVIYDQGPDLRKFNPKKYEREVKKIKREFNLQDTPFIVGLISKFTKNKGQEVLVKAAKYISEKTKKEIKYLLIGEKVKGHEKYFKGIKKIVKKAKIKNNFIFTGYRKDIPALMETCDIIAHIPLHEDPFPGVILEAMAMEKPIIATKSGGILEQIKDGSSGILIPKNNYKDLAQAIINLSKNPQKREKIGKRAKEMLIKKFSQKKYYTKLEEIYNTITKL